MHVDTENAAVGIIPSVCDLGVILTDFFDQVATGVILTVILANFGN